MMPANVIQEIKSYQDSSTRSLKTELYSHAFDRI